MVREIKVREQMKQDLIQKIGPWAFYSYNRKYWPEMPDNKIIEGAILYAPENEKLKLLDIFTLNEIKNVWKKNIVIQSEWHQAANLWAAEHIFKVANPKRYVRMQCLKSQELRLREGITF